jgi:hypothetical protein
MKKLFLSIMIAAGLFGLVSGQVTQSQSTESKDQDKKDGWEKIGEKTVNLSEESGIFNWDTDREKTINANEKYSAIKFKAKDATVNLTNIEVEYEGGKKQDLSLIGPVMANSESKVVKLESGDKKLDKITFNYKKDVTAIEDKVKVELWGLKADAASGMGQRDKDLDIDVDVDRMMGDTSMMDHHNTKPKSHTDMDRTDADKTKVDGRTTPVVPR